MNQVQKKYVILGSLCALLLTLAVGYAAFSSVLNITGTTNINSEWNVQITYIDNFLSNGASDNINSPSYDNTNGLSATFNVFLEKPGDYATYRIEITNKGSIDAKLTNITIPENTNQDIVFYVNKDNNNRVITGALKQNDTLYKSGDVGYVYVTVLYKDYENQQTAQNETASMTISFDFEQATGNNVGTSGDSDFTGIVYSRHATRVEYFQGNAGEYINIGDPISKITDYTEDYTSLNDNDLYFFFKNNITNGQVVSNELCFINNGLHCLKQNEFETTKNTLLQVFGESMCDVSDDESNTYVQCSFNGGYVGLYSEEDGNFMLDGSITKASFYILSNGSTNCIIY